MITKMLKHKERIWN